MSQESTTDLRSPASVEASRLDLKTSPSLHVAVVDEELPYPANSGKRIRTLNILSRLARSHRVALLTHSNLLPEEVSQAKEQLQRLGIEVIVVDRRCPPRSVTGRGFRFYLDLASNLLSPRPYLVDVNYSPELREAVRSYDREHRVDLWQSEWTPYVEALRDIEPARKLIVAHNIESLIWRRYQETEGNPFRRAYIKLQYKKFLKYERMAFRAASRVVAVSEEDATLARDWLGTRSVSVVENGVDLDYIRPGEVHRLPKQILYLGSLDWRPNLDAVEMLIGRIFPQILADEPDARLCIVGRNPPPKLVEQLAGRPGIELHADVPDVRPFLHQSALMVVPLRIGGGSRLKILEAFAAGLPVISTRVGAEGLKVRDGAHLVVVEKIEQMAAAIVASLRDQATGLARAKLGRRLVEEAYDWDVLADRLGDLWLRTCRRPAHEAAASGAR